uniref:Uncharacterized protein n=1 Tax=Aegilops tauschii subsp. strangulata TaxID=200361 RepID=A0A453F8Z0_AEGTS
GASPRRDPLKQLDRVDLYRPRHPIAPRGRPRSYQIPDQRTSLDKAANQIKSHRQSPGERHIVGDPLKPPTGTAKLRSWALPIESEASSKFQKHGCCKWQCRHGGRNP